MNVIPKKPDAPRAGRLGLKILALGAAGVPMEEALRLADGAGAVLASNRRISQALERSGEWKGAGEIFACWSGTLVGYDLQDKKLGRSIESVSHTGIRYIFPVPRRFVGEKNVVLVAEHPNLTLERRGRDRIVLAENVGLVEAFPATDGWFLRDPAFDIPTGKEADIDNEAAKYFWRVDKHVGLVARGHSGDYYGPFSHDHKVFDSFRVVVEAAADITQDSR